MAKKGKSKKKAEVMFLVCEETGDYNYTVRRKPGGEKLKLKKFCPRLQKHTIHNEKEKIVRKKCSGCLSTVRRAQGQCTRIGKLLESTGTPKRVPFFMQR